MARSLFWLPDEAWKSPICLMASRENRAGTIGLSCPALHVLKTGCRWRDVAPAFWATGDHLQPRQSLVPAPYLAAHFRENGGRRSSS
jgi:hypothetical protein